MSAPVTIVIEYFLSRKTVTTPLPITLIPIAIGVGIVKHMSNTFFK